MRIIISPAKTMIRNTDTFGPKGMPVFTDKTELLRVRLCGMSYEECKALWGCNDKLARLNYERLEHMDLREGLTPALFSYEGIQYQYMASRILETEDYEYLQDHLRILSGFYGVLKPFDGIVPYRLEMQARLSCAGRKDLYHFWGDDLYREVMDDSRMILDPASKEYSKCIERYLTPEDEFVTVVFGELSGGKVVQKGTYAKMARGEMVHFMAEHRVKAPEEIRSFTGLDYHFCEERSSQKEYIFLRG